MPGRDRPAMPEVSTPGRLDAGSPDAGFGLDAGTLDADVFDGSSDAAFSGDAG